MAVRPVYIPKNSAPFYDIVNIEFKWNGGFAVSQKQKNIKAIHDGFKLIYPEANPLEISSKSLIQTGVELSAFNLMKYVPELKKSFPIENVYQAGKVFENGCQYTDLMLVSPKDAKRDERLKNSGKLTMFRFSGQNFPLIPESLFYNYIYMMSGSKVPDFDTYELFRATHFHNSGIIYISFILLYESYR